MNGEALANKPIAHREIASKWMWYSRENYGTDGLIGDFQLSTKDWALVVGAMTAQLANIATQDDVWLTTSTRAEKMDFNRAVTFEQFQSANQWFHRRADWQSIAADR